MQITPQETMIMTQLIRDTRINYSKMCIVVEKMAEKYPELAKTLKTIIADIEKQKLTRRIKVDRDELTLSDKAQELISELIRIGNDSTLKLVRHLKDFREEIDKAPQERKEELTSLHSELYRYHDNTVGAIMKEASRIFSMKSSTPVQ